MNCDWIGQGEKVVVEIVSSKNRVVLDMSDRIYVYIPMTRRENKFFASDIIDACWRLCYFK